MLLKSIVRTILKITYIIAAILVYIGITFIPYWIERDIITSLIIFFFVPIIGRLFYLIIILHDWAFNNNNNEDK